MQVPPQNKSEQLPLSGKTRIKVNFAGPLCDFLLTDETSVEVNPTKGNLKNISE